MTVVVGVLCKDGVVIGCDSVATSSAGMRPIMQVASNDKIRIFNEAIIVAATGAVGYMQRLQEHVAAAIHGGVFRNMERRECAGNISQRFLRDLQNTMAQNHPQNGIGFGALVAWEKKNAIHLAEFATNNFQPEFKEGKLFYVSMGSGQNLADPFLAFVSRVLWKDTTPDIRYGKLGVYWALSHTLQLAPGMVGPPIRIASLEKMGDKWVAAGSDDLQEHEQFIKKLELAIGSQALSIIEEAKSLPLPDLPPED